MPVDPAHLEGIFSEALTKPTSAERAVFLDESCKGDSELRHRVDRLLAAHESARNVVAPISNLATIESEFRAQERPGARIGPYKLLEQIGEGGFGVVFLAEQEHPVRRRVALKIIKLGMDTKQVVARFEAERQALAMMDHPNIAKVLEAGETDTGRPFFVMELVKGVPITTYCDQRQLAPRARLELFEHVCHAVQHAHQKGIIHRDIKPTNVLISRHDDRPVVKVIDFGIAKATCARLTEKTVFTEMRQMIGTPAYMSPEQAGQSDLDIDTRSDIYSLGVLLYELLTGTTPFDSHELLQASYGEIQRIIREVDPPRPSTRVSSLRGTLVGIAANRQVEPDKLCRLIRGDLDWIVMRCLEKDRRRRYETASSLAADIQRHLDDAPVEASPASLIYQLMKFARRHRVGVITGVVTATALLLGIIGTTRGMLWAMNERNRAMVAESRQRLERERADAARELAQESALQSEQILRFLQEMLSSIDPDRSITPDVTVREILDQSAGKVETAFPDQPEVRAHLHQSIAQVYIGLRLFGSAKQHLDKAIALRRQHMMDDSSGLAETLCMYAELPTENANDAELALSRCREAVAIWSANLSPDDSRIAIAKAFEAHLSNAAKPEKRGESDVWAVTILPILSLLGADQLSQMSPEWADTIRQARSLQQAGLSEQARAVLIQWRVDSLKRIREMCAAGQFDAATQYARQQYAPMLGVSVLRSIVPLGMMSVVQDLKSEHEDNKVIELFIGEVLYSSRIVSGEDSTNVAWAQCELAKLRLQEKIRAADAESPAREALRIRRKALGNEHPLTVESLDVLADALEAKGDVSAAEGLRRQRLDHTRRRSSVDPGETP